MSKFFIPLGFRYNGYWHTGTVWGPYPDDAAVNAALAEEWPNEKKDQFLVFDGELVNSPPSPLEKPEHLKRPAGDESNYVKQPDGSYKCRDCSAIIKGARVAHPVHDRNMPGAGGGECQYETIPYCPNCETEPDFHGAPVYE